MRRALHLDVSVCAAAGLFYLINRLWLQHVTSGPVGWFLACYANDIFAGAAMVAWLNLLLGLGGLGRMRAWTKTAFYLLLCGLVWEYAAPLWKPGAIFDPWDFAAYQAGGVAYQLLDNYRRRFFP